MNAKHYAVAIDGPGGAGKSTIAREVARELGLTYVDTGAIYRTLGVQVLRRRVDPRDAPAVSALLPETHIELTYGEDGLQRMFLGGEDVTEEIRRQEVSMTASQIAALPEVRAFLLEMQRDMARRYSVVMDGRDIGTVVLPQAEVKIFLTASAETRARRRYLELVQRGTPKEYEELYREMVERDYTDSHREAAPLRPAADAVTLDTSDLNFRESCEAVLKLIRERVGV